jgi:hypothetical protein
MDLHLDQPHTGWDYVSPGFHFIIKVEIRSRKKTIRLSLISFCTMYSLQALMCANASTSVSRPSASALSGSMAYFVGVHLEQGTNCAWRRGRFSKRCKGCCLPGIAVLLLPLMCNGNMSGEQVLKSAEKILLLLPLPLPFSLATVSLWKMLERRWQTQRLGQSRRPCTCHWGVRGCARKQGTELIAGVRCCLWRRTSLGFHPNSTQRGTPQSEEWDFADQLQSPLEGGGLCCKL